jgi:N-acetylglutamate synthase-like GNAT family acetyltransferase
MSENQAIQLDQLDVRTFQREDLPHVKRLYREGLLAGQIPANDTGLDIDNIQEAYFSDPASHFWVAAYEGQIVGMIGVARDREHVAEIRRLRVDSQWRQTLIAARLIERAVAHCRQHSYLKVVLDTRFEKNAAVDMFERFGFQHTRSRPTHEKELLEFYLDLYRPHDPHRRRT